MNEINSTRRDFLKAVGLGMATIAMPSCLSIPGRVAKSQTFTFAQICDTQLGMGGYEHDVETFKQAVAQINTLEPDFVVICGDLVNTPNERSFADFKKIKSAFNVPCYCVPGNHDVGNEPSLKSLRDYRKIMGKDYYSFEHRGCLFVVVNTQLWKSPLKDESTMHDSWLEATLKKAADKRARIFVLGHHPLFLKNPDEEEAYMNLPIAKRKKILSLFEKHGVVAMLGGHTHQLMINDYKGIQLVNGETTSKNFDKRPLGFRVWHVTDRRPFKHDFVSLAGKQLHSGVDLHEGLVYSSVDVELTMDLWVPRRSAEPVPCVIVIQGGGFLASGGQMVRPLAEYFAENGFAAATIAYRGQPNHTYRDTIADVKAAVRYVRRISGERGMDPDRIGAMGGSAGGTLAALLAVTGGMKEFEGKGGHSGFSSRIQAAVGCAGVYDFIARFSDKQQISMQPEMDAAFARNRGWIGEPFSPTNEDWRNASPINHVDKTSAPMVLMHCKDDPVVPWMQSQNMHERMRAVGSQCEIELYETGGHGIGGQVVKPRALEFFKKTLGPVDGADAKP
jgi:acetyl esterase/lipase